MCTRGVPTTCSSKILAGWKPPYDATIVTRLAAGRGDPGRQDQPRRVRDGLEHRELGVRSDPQPARHQPRARRVVAADRRRRSPPGSRRWRSAPTPAGRSGSRRRCAAWSGSSPPTDGSAATGWSRSPAASTRSGRSRTPWPTPLAPCRSCAVTIRSTRRRSRSRCPTTRPCSTAASTACAIGRIVDLPEGADPDVVERTEQAFDALAAGGRDDRRRRGAGVHVRPHRLLHHRPRRGVVEPGPLRRRALRPAGRGARHQRDVRGHPHRRVRRRGQAPDPARHVRPVGRLLRRLLRQGAADPAADGQRLRQGLRAGRCADHARPRRASPSRSARRPPIRWRCTCATRTRSRPISPATRR